VNLRTDGVVRLRLQPRRTGRCDAKFPCYCGQLPCSGDPPLAEPVALFQATSKDELLSDEARLVGAFARNEFLDTVVVDLHDVKIAR